jgi:hypothetical protein
MPRRTLSAKTAPAVTAKHDRDHRVRRRERRYGNPALSQREVRPLNWFATREGESDR